MDISIILIIISVVILASVIAVVGYFCVLWWKKRNENSEILLSPNINFRKQKDPSFSLSKRKQKKEKAQSQSICEIKNRLSAQSNDDADRTFEQANEYDVSPDSPLTEHRSLETQENGVTNETSNVSEPSETLVQEKLLIEEFIPPNLPEPPESLLYAKEFCYIIRFYAEQNIGISVMQQVCDFYNKNRINCYRILGYDETAKVWKLLGKSSFRYLLLALPLADRGGKLSKDQIKLIEEEGRGFAERMKIHAIFPTISSTLNRVEVLDAFCESVDFIVEFRVRMPQTYTLEQIEEYLSLNKMTVGNKQATFRRDSEEIFKAVPNIQSNNNIQTILFSLDVPKVTRPIQALDDMMKLIERFAKNVNGTIENPLGHAVDAEKLATIRKQLMHIVAKMNDNNVPPGGSLSHLLFS